MIRIYLFLFFAFFTCMAGAAPVDMQIQILTAQLEQLKQERD